MRYPIFVDLTGRRVLVVGGGSVVARRTPDLIEAGADVVVVAPVTSPDLPDTVTVVARRYEAADLDGAWLVLAATDDPEVNASVAADAERNGVFCIRADDASASSAWRPAAVTVDDLTVAVSASGDPVRAVRLRDAIETGLRAGNLSARPERPTGGRVVLVGGGPGDPDLLTLRGLRELQNADVIVTDRLGPTGLLDRLSAEIEVIDVGKTPGGHAAEQAEINATLVARAEAGQRVVRLKGGDPFVLGRGSEELDACLAAGIAVEVVPGITSATSAATLAGIALTERGTAQQFTVVSGHVPPGDERSSVDWAALATGPGTLVLLMAVANLGPITAALIAGGRGPATPTAIVENASLPDQRVTRGRLDEAAQIALAAQVRPPAVVIIGDVVRLV